MKNKANVSFDNFRLGFANAGTKSAINVLAGHILKIFFLSALLLFGSLPLFSEARNALLIANSSYKNFGSLATPVNEARDLKKSLVQLGFTVTIVENGSREKMLDSVADFEKTLKSKGGIGFFHYGGHAVQVNGKNYLIPVDADIPDERRVATRSVDVDEIMASMVADTNIVILDACRNNPLPASSGRSATRGLVLTQEKPKNSIIVYSAEAGKVAQDGVFTPLLSQKILEKKSLYAILLDVRREVNRRTNGEQTPKNDDGLMTEVYLAGYEMPQTVSQKENYQNQNSTEQNPQQNNQKQNQNNQKLQNQNNNTNTKTGEEFYILGNKALSEKNYNDAFKYYNQALEQGYNYARTNIGFCYEGGYGVKVDLKKAVEFYKAAALDGEPYAQCNLGNMYRLGSGVTQDFSEARKWYLKSAEQGQGRAMYCLGILYEFGAGVTMDKKEALSWYEKAASKNYENAKEKVASLKQAIEEEQKKAQDSAKQAEEYYNIGYDAHVKKDYKKAVEYYEKALETGEFSSILYCKINLAKLYIWSSDGVTQDFRKGFDLCKDAAEGGIADAQSILGRFYNYGWGNVKIDYKEALKWYEKAIEQGNIDAKYNAGYIYYTNLGGNFNLQKGRKYLQEASAAGNGLATDFIKKCGDKF